MEKPLWKFIDDKATFSSLAAGRINSLYFPLCNSAPIMSSVTPALHGDLKTGYHSFLLEPSSRPSLVNSKINRNFWIYINPKKIWSATANSKDPWGLQQYDDFLMEAGLLWHKIIRQNKKIGLKTQITSFIPASGEPVELMCVEITNISAKTIKFIPTAAIPLFARSADNLHDHRHVTSLLERIRLAKSGVIVKPALAFDESGHKKNLTSYFVFGIGPKNAPPQYIYPTQEDFTGEASDLQAPQAVIDGAKPGEKANIQGKEAMAGLKFRPCLLAPKKTACYIIVMGITQEERKIEALWQKFNAKDKAAAALEETKLYWQEKSAQITLKTRDDIFDSWVKWVAIQPALRRIFGCSFLPDFDYGKGGRGWRDLWQDCLALILDNPEEAKNILINNFSGVRIDGSNATIIGPKTAEFIADRNNIARVWTDHGAWPLITCQLYIHQTGDLKILLEKTTYFRDYQLARSKERDSKWSPREGTQLKTKDKEIYEGSILEHMLIQNLVQFFNVGAHNITRLEGADWNDGLDMACEHGESVAFCCMYAQNLRALADLTQQLDAQNISLLKETLILLDSLKQTQTDYSNPKTKQQILENYFQNTKYAVSGIKVPVPKEELIRDLKQKSEWLSAHISRQEWLKDGFFNGYYNNDKQRLEGEKNGVLRMTLSGQVFPVLSGIASEEQVRTLWNNACEYLKDKKLGGLRLNTDFGEEQLNMGRAFSFVYGDKENGAIFNHMCVMFAYALYKRGFAKEGYEIINSIYKMSIDTPRSKIYPCLPEYFNAEGRGMYSYLTGSASWFMLTLLTQAFGIRGEYGGLLIEPKLTAGQFKYSDDISIGCRFAGRPVRFSFLNPSKKDFAGYSIRRVSFNGKTIAEKIKQPRFFLSRSYFLSLADNKNNIIELLLD